MSSSDSDTLKSPQERKMMLRSVLSTAQNLQENINKQTIYNLESIMDKADLIASETSFEEKVNDQEEIVLDAKMMSISSSIIKQCTISVTKDISSYDPVEYAEKIRSYTIRLSDTTVYEPNWFLLEREVTKYFKKMPNYSVLYGALQPMPKKEVARRQITKEAQAVTKRPKNVVVVDKEEDSVEESVERIRKIIIHYDKRNKRPLHYFKLVLHPSDFGRTIENMLYVSFLVRDGIIKLYKDNTGALVIKPMSKEAVKQAKESGKSVNIQNVFAINQEQWKILKRAYKISKPMVNFVRES